MAIYENTRFSGRTVNLDGNAFRGCSFEDCSLKFSAIAATELNGCDFARCQIVADGPAELAIGYLKGFYHGLGEWGQATVESLFESIRGPAEALPGHRAALEAFGASPEGQAIVRGFDRLSAAHRREIAALIGRPAETNSTPTRFGVKVLARAG